MFFRQQTPVECSECGTEARAWQLLDGGVHGKAFAPELPAGWTRAGEGAVCGRHTVQVHIETIDTGRDVTAADVG